MPKEIQRPIKAKGPNPLAPDHDSRFARGRGGDCIDYCFVQDSTIFTMYTQQTCVDVRKSSSNFWLLSGTSLGLSASLHML
jgi:hypothetical protein